MTSKFLMIFVLAMFACKGCADKPKFKYIERNLLKITYDSSVNRALYMCCNVSEQAKDKRLEMMKCSILNFSICPVYKMITNCASKGSQTCCKIDFVLNHVKMNGYIGKVNDSSVPPSEVATYVTTKLGQVPKSVSELNVTTNSQHGLTINWIPLKEDDVYLNQNAAYTYLLQCRSSDPYAKVIRMKVGDVYRTELPYLSYFIDARSLSAITQYRCCLVVVNMVTSLESEETCKNIVTSEQAPSSAPVILCGNSSHECHSIVNGNKRSIIVLYKVPPPASTNGKIVRNMLYYKTANDDTYDQLLVNGSETQAVIANATTDENYDVYMRSCNTVDCSAVSNTVRIAAILKKITSGKNYLKIILSLIFSIVVVTVLIIICLRRCQQRKLRDPLEKLTPKDEAPYRYPVNDSPNTEYDVIKLDNVNLDRNSNIRKDPSVVVSNPMVTTANAK